MQYSQGLILKSRVEEIPLRVHFGVVIIENGEVMVMHNTVDKGVIIESFEEYSEDRVVEETFESKLMSYSKDELYRDFDRCKGEFDTLNYNCEHFIDCMLGHPHKSEQLYRVGLITAALLLAYSIYRA